MKKSIPATKKQIVFFALVFIYGFFFQPSWVVDNFWLKADFYSALPFQFPCVLFLFFYSVLSMCASVLVVRAIKRNL
jgi:hypothetical protein